MNSFIKRIVIAAFVVASAGVAVASQANAQGAKYSEKYWSGTSGASSQGVGLSIQSNDRPFALTSSKGHGKTNVLKSKKKHGGVHKKKYVKKYGKTYSKRHHKKYSKKYKTRSNKKRIVFGHKKGWHKNRLY